MGNDSKGKTLHMQSTAQPFSLAINVFSCPLTQFFIHYLNNVYKTCTMYVQLLVGVRFSATTIKLCYES